jgi:hypothetical protein
MAIIIHGHCVLIDRILLSLAELPFGQLLRVPLRLKCITMYSLM